jgi:hypothetical protein
MLLAGLLGAITLALAPAGELFDDFAAGGRDALAAHGWTRRGAAGPPGAAGARWEPDAVELRSGLLRLTASSDGTVRGTQQAELCQRRKFREGTYAARVRFSDGPVQGRDGDEVVETFYAISPLLRPRDPSYSELDLEYLPNGGWGQRRPTLWATSWETFSPEPHWFSDAADGRLTRSWAGWHTLVIHVAAGRVTYLADGRLLARHGGRFYPESLMSIDFNLWFLPGGTGTHGPVRRYREEVDWVLQASGVVLSPAQVAERVSAYRAAKVSFADSVPAASPPLRTHCAAASEPG